MTAMSAPNANINDAISTARSWFDWVLGIAFWLAITAVTIVFIHQVAKDWGFSTRYIPLVDYGRLIYAAGIIYLLRGR